MRPLGRRCMDAAAADCDCTWRCTVDSRRQLALTLLLGLSTSLGCKAMPWSSSEPTAPTVSAPNAGKQRYELLAKEFPQESAAAGIGGPAAPPDENWFVSSWKKTTAAVTAPFTPKTVVENDDPVSLSTKPGKINPGVYISAAHILENQGKFAEAEAKYQAALKASPNDLTTLISLARCYDRQNKNEEAIETYKKALKHHPKSALAYNDIGLCYGRQRNTEEAVKHLTKAIELQPSNVRYYNNLATVYVEAGRTDEAVQLLSRVNSPAVANYNVACLLHAHGKQAQAAVHLQAAIAQDGNLTQARELLAAIGGPAAQPQQRIAAMPVSTGAAGPYGQPPAYTPAPQMNVGPYAMSSGAPPAAAAAAPPQQGPYTAQPQAMPENSFSPWR